MPRLLFSVGDRRRRALGPRPAAGDWADAPPRRRRRPCRRRRRAGPARANGYSWGSNWAGGSGSALFADFVWMYDDGPGAENGDCIHAGDHRENILARLPAPIAMGAGAHGRSLAELFVGGYRPASPGGSDPLLSPSWAQLAP